MIASHSFFADEVDKKREKGFGRIPKDIATAIHMQASIKTNLVKRIILSYSE